MAINLQQLVILAAILISTATAALPPPPTTQDQTLHHASEQIAIVLSSLGYDQLSTVAVKSLFNTTGPITVFAASDNSILTCPSCSLSLLLQEHSVPSLYPLSLLLSYPFGTKIQTISPQLRCLTVTSSTGSGSKTVFINGVEITRPNLYRNTFMIVHGIQGFLSHLSPLSCNVESMTSLYFPAYPAPFTPFFMMRLMLKDAMLRLRIGGYSVLALALRGKYKELLDLRAATVFALDDESIFYEGHVYVRDLKLHIVPNKRLTANNLVVLPVGTALPTLERGVNLEVTTAGGGGLLEPMRINYVKLKNLDLVVNQRIAVHGVAQSFRPVLHKLAAEIVLSHNYQRLGFESLNVDVDDYNRD